MRFSLCRVVVATAMVLMSGVFAEDMAKKLCEKANEVQNVTPVTVRTRNPFTIASPNRLVVQEGDIANGETITSVYRNCLPTNSFAVNGMLKLLSKCESCVAFREGPFADCPKGCCATLLRNVEQVVLCGENLGCMRLFGPSNLHLWTWEGKTGFVEDLVEERKTCAPMVRDESLGQACAVRFGIDDEGNIVLAPCPVGEFTGFLVPSKGERVSGPVQCALAPSLANEQMSPVPISSFSPDLVKPSDDPEVSTEFLDDLEGQATESASPDMDSDFVDSMAPSSEPAGPTITPAVRA